MKKMTLENLKTFRDDMRVPISDSALEADVYQPPYFHPGNDDEAIQYLHERRRALGGYLPERRSKYTQVSLPSDDVYDGARKGSGKQEIATTMAFARLLKDLLKNKTSVTVWCRSSPMKHAPLEWMLTSRAPRFITRTARPTPRSTGSCCWPIRKAPKARFCTPESTKPERLRAFTATGTSYATHGEPMVPIYVFYSMFGFQRTGDAMWAAGDQMARGFIMGATAGRTTLTGEGLQHADGHSPLLASTNPAVVTYDPAYSYEIAHIVKAGLERMYGGNHPDPNVMYYLTMYNEPMVQPEEPEGLDVEGLLKGLYLLKKGPLEGAPKATILASGVGMAWALEAQELLATDWGVSADVYSVTSWNELRRDGVEAERHNFLHPDQPARVPYVTEKLQAARGPDCRRQ
jgi:pyruvate dehydrogenase E1 component